MTKLDEIALNIELVLISIIEGVALASLSGAAVEVAHSPFNLVSWVFIVAGLLLLLVFWSQAILHAVSFIRWPLRMEHMLLYFVAAFLQIMAYSNLENPVAWFEWWLLFSLLVFFTYLVDLRVIKDSITKFSVLPDGKTYIEEVLRRHKYELSYLVPLSIAFNVLALGAVWYFTNPLVPLTLGILQVVISLGALVDCVRNFHSRGRLLPSLFGS